MSIKLYTDQNQKAYLTQYEGTTQNGKAQSKTPKTRSRDQLVISEEGLKAAQNLNFRKETKVCVDSKTGDLVENGLVVNVDNTGEIERAAAWEERAKQINLLTTTIKEYYAKAHEENLSFDNPSNHIVAKYKFQDSPYFRADLSEEERDMAFQQEHALLWGGSLTLNDSYALASIGGARDIEEGIQEAVKKRLDQAKEELLQKIESNKV